MRRDWELIRQILRKVEDKPDTHGLVHPNQFTGYDEETVSYHMWLLDQARLIEATCQTHMGGPVFCMARNLTWAGHEFLDQIGNDTAWNRIGSFAKEKALDLSFDTIKQITARIVTMLLGGE